MLGAFLLLSTLQSSIRWEPFQLAGSVANEFELGHLSVPERHAKPDGKQIELAFVRLKSKNPNPGPPIIYLDGGPGSSPIELARVPDYFNVFDKLREAGDVILLDQRGIGRSRPALSMLSKIPVTPDMLTNKESILKIWLARAVEARKAFEDQGVDTQAYNTEESADDVDALRQALGASTMNILGFSYGTHLGLSVIRRHGAHVAHAALVGVEGPDSTSKLPMEGDRQLDRLNELIQKDPAWAPLIPNFKELVKRVFAKLDREPAKVAITVASKPVELTVGKDGMQLLILRDLGDSNDHPWFPKIFYLADKGDYSFLARIAQRRYLQFAPGTSLMNLMCDASSGCSSARRNQIDQEAERAIFGNMMNVTDALGPALGNPDLGDQFRSPIKSTVPTLFVSGTLDWNTPPDQAAQIRKGFKNSAQIIVENAGHESQLTQPFIYEAILAWFSGKGVANERYSIAPPKFLAP